MSYKHNLFNNPKEFSKAERNFQRAITREPGQDNFYWLLGDVYRADRRLEDAREYYVRATRLDPNDGTVFAADEALGTVILLAVSWQSRK